MFVLKLKHIDDSEVVMLLENGTQETGSDKLILNGTDDHYKF